MLVVSKGTLIPEALFQVLLYLFNRCIFKNVSVFFAVGSYYYKIGFKIVSQVFS